MTNHYEVLAVRYATRSTLESDVYLNHHMYSAPNDPIDMDYFFWVVRNDERTIIVDTGFTPEVGEPRGRTMTCPVPEGLARLGIDPAEVDLVVITHCHYDHTGNLGLFPGVPIVIADRELTFWSGPMAKRFQFAASLEADDVDLILQREREGGVTRISGTTEIAPGVKAIDVGGHTPGQLILLVDGKEGTVLLTSDAVHYYAEVERDWPFIIAADLPETYRALDTVNELSRVPGTSYVAGHDPLVLQRFPPIDDSDPGFGVRVS
jgi:glyoxylase-like metal-dependent hydrolase (beta-lactamase superfamily II)